jgi:hypothetical protein
MTSHSRRSTDNRVGDIEALISGENDPKQRAFLIILNSINASMVANTEATREVADKLDNHLSAFETKAEADAQILNQGRGAWRVLAWVLGTVQVSILAISGYVFSDLQKIHAELTQSNISDARLDARINLLERK